ncbi:hypothetical protein SSX86_020994 [Deinandra increscens subsp. villosa]|uniref:Uncharacterized protein n=1 Tax=Deinandra increscens subsp. villosa TaxID=3103831 RepID=A0AAP0CTT5_9ASTR
MAAAEEGSVSTSRRNGGSTSIDLVESHRWIFPDSDDSEIDEDGEEELPLRNGMDSEDEDNAADHRLIRTGPKVDSLDVETLEVSPGQRLDLEVCFWISNSFGVHHFILGLLI